MDITQYKCIIIDDEPVAHYVLVSHIEKNANLTLVAQFYNAVDAMNYLRNNQVDLLLLDIDMPELSGIDLLKSLSNVPHTILTTAHSQYALESYDYEVIDYLLKPISLPRFIKSVDRFLALHQKFELNEPKEITIKVDGKNITLKTDDIDFIQSYGNYIKIFTSQRIYVASSTTQEVLENLSPSSFIRVHKSYIVNISKVTTYTENNLIINDNNLPVGITFKREFLQRMKKRLKT